MENKKHTMHQLITTLEHYERSEELLSDLLAFYDMHSKQFNTIDVYRIPPHGDKTQPKQLWKSRADVLNDRIRKHINYDDSE